MVTPALQQDKAAFARVEAPCPYFGTCGGCALQDLAYDDQRALKRERLQRAFASLPEAPAVDVAGLEDPWRYRNKAELTFGEAGGALTLGFHAARSFWRVVDLEDCLLLPEPVMPILRHLRALAAATGLPAYQSRTHRGFFRYVLVRYSRATSRVLLCLMTASGPREAVEGLARELTVRHPAVTGFSWGVTDRLADIAVPERLIHLTGAEHLEEQVGPFHLRVRPLSFLQSESALADRLYQALGRAVEKHSGGIAWDLYCGIGVAGLYLSKQFRKVYGIDSDPQHLELARLNASLNGVGNIDFRSGRVEELLKDRRFWLQEAAPDVIVVDPPRTGLHPQALSSLLAARPRTIAYISCNAQTLVRDLASLLSSFPRYRFAEAQAFDMFPQTPHVETLAILHRR